MKAIIVPGITDLNKGDQALVWESHRLAIDTKLFKEISILNLGDNEEEKKMLCQQSMNYGLNMVENILKHPRRGKHKNNEYIKDSNIQFLLQVKNAVFDFLSTLILIKIAKNLSLVKKLYSSKIYNSVKKFSEVDAVFIKGGGFIHAYGEITAPYLMWYFLFYIRLAIALEKKIIFLPNSYGPFNGLTVKRQIKTVFNKVDLIYARENISAKNLENLLSREISVEMDLGFFIQSNREKDAINILNQYQILDNEKTVGMTVRPWRFTGMSNPSELYEKYIDSMAKLIKYINEIGFKVVLCNQSLGPNAHEDDRNAIKTLLEKINSNRVIWLNENLDCITLKSVYSKFDYFVGTRFHSIIFSLTSLVPSIAIAYGGNKANGIMNDLGLEEYVLPISCLDFDILRKTFDNLMSHREEIIQKLVASQESIMSSRARIINNIQKLWEK